MPKEYVLKSWGCKNGLSVKIVNHQLNNQILTAKIRSGFMNLSSSLIPQRIVIMKYL